MISIFESQRLPSRIKQLFCLDFVSQRFFLYILCFSFCFDYQVWSNMWWSSVCDQLKGVDAFDHTRPGIVQFLDLLDSYMTTLLKLAFVSILVVMSDADSQHVFKIQFTFWLHLRLKDDKLVFDSAAFTQRRLQLVSQKACWELSTNIGNSCLW